VQQCRTSFFNETVSVKLCSFKHSVPLLSNDKLVEPSLFIVLPCENQITAGSQNNLSGGSNDCSAAARKVTSDDLPSFVREADVKVRLALSGQSSDQGNDLRVSVALDKLKKNTSYVKTILAMVL